MKDGGAALSVPPRVSSGLIDAELSRVALQHPHVSRLMSIAGIDATVALSIVAAVAEFTRFAQPAELVAYLGLHPRVRQSGGDPAKHGPITQQGRAHARGMLVEAAWAAAKPPGPLRAFSTSGSAAPPACTSRWSPPPARSPPC